MSTLSDALEAMDKATPGEFGIDCPSGEGKTWVCTKDGTIIAVFQKLEDAEFFFSVFKALAWIKEALPWLEGIRDGMAGLVRKPDAHTKLKALIARANPEEANHA